MSHPTTMFSVGDRVDRTLPDGTEVDGHVMAVLNYGRVVTVQWPDGTATLHLAQYLTHHQPTEGA